MATMMGSVGFQDFMSSENFGSNVDSPSQNVRKISRSETIHSGHFMVSEIDDSETQGDQQNTQAAHESDYDQPDVSSNQLTQMFEYDFNTACKETTQAYSYGPKCSNSVLIDVSLTKLFECMSLAYSGKITSPKWKTFKGLKLKLKDKIRMNNIIWRAWHIQYISGRKPVVCQFSSPVDSDNHKKPEAIILEGKYWKRRLATVTAEYQKWRMYYRKRGKPQSPSRPSHFDWENRWPVWASTSSMPGFQSDDDFAMDFSDHLFNTLLQPNIIDFPNPREIARSGIGAEFIQPGLVQLQPTPNFDDFMDFEPLDLILTLSSKNIPLPTLPEETAAETHASNLIQANSKMSGGSQNESDLLNSLLCQTTQSGAQLNNESLKSFPNAMKQNASSRNTLHNNCHQLNSGISQTSSPQYKTGPAKQLQEPVFTQFTSPTIGQQTSEVPLPQIQSQIQSTNQVNVNQTSLLYTLTGENSASFQPQFGIRDLDPSLKNIKPEYYNVNSRETHIEKFVVPKSAPPKQRSRSRSISSPQINNDISPLAAFIQPHNAMSLTDIHSVTSSHNAEKSLSLPVYTQPQERRRSVASMPSRSIDVPINHLYHQLQDNKLQMTPPTNNIISIALPSAPTVSSQSSFTNNQIVFPNSPSYNIAQGSSALIAQLLTSAPTNNIRSLSHTFTAAAAAAAAATAGTQSIAALQRDVLSNNAANNSSTTIDASCIGIPVTTGANANKPQSPLFSQAFKDGNSNNLPNNSQLPANKQNSIFPSTSNIRSPPATQMYCMPSPYKSRSPVTLPSPKEVLINMPSVPSAPSPPSLTITPPLPVKVGKTKSVEDRIKYNEHRRVCHINAEQKRRCNIKNGFDTLRNLLPSVSQNTNTKISKAAMLQKAAEYIRTLKVERQSQQEEYDMLKQQIESLNQTIGVFQNQLPATGAPISCQRASQSKELYENYVKTRTLQNWKFWIFSIIMESLFESYNSTVATTNVDEMCKTLLRWLDQNCCLVILRRDVLNSLRYLSTSTNILTNPSSLPDEAVLAVTKKEKQSSA